MTFRKFKDIAIVPVHRFLTATSKWPRLQRILLGALGLALKAGYFVPGNHFRRTVRSFCRVSGRTDGRRIFFTVVDNGLRAAMAFSRLHRHGADAVADMVTFDAESQARLERMRQEHGAGIVVVPHCAGSVLSAAGFGRGYNAVVLVRESKSPARSGLMKQYFERLGPELLYVRNTDPMTVARSILKALHEKRLVIGTTDLARPTGDTVEVTVFGERVTLPAWPARFSSRRKAPILPGYIRMVGDRIVLTSGEPFIADDLAAGTQRWASFFEQSIRESPADWLFMFDKRWSRILAAAAAKAT